MGTSHSPEIDAGRASRSAKQRKREVNVKSVLLAYVDGVLDGRPKSEFSRLRIVNHTKGQAAMLKRLLEVSTCPDFIEDKGHYYGHNMSDEDKRALIEYVKYF